MIKETELRSLAEEISTDYQRKSYAELQQLLALQRVNPDAFLTWRDCGGTEVLVDLTLAQLGRHGGRVSVEVIVSASDDNGRPRAACAYFECFPDGRKRVSSHQISATVFVMIACCLFVVLALAAWRLWSFRAR